MFNQDYTATAPETSEQIDTQNSTATEDYDERVQDFMNLAYSQWHSLEKANECATYLQFVTQKKHRVTTTRDGFPFREGFFWIEIDEPPRETSTAETPEPTELKGFEEFDVPLPVLSNKNALDAVNDECKVPLPTSDVDYSTMSNWDDYATGDEVEPDYDSTYSDEAYEREMVSRADDLEQYNDSLPTKITGIEKQIFKSNFPDVIEKENAKGQITQRILPTIPNLRYLLKCYGITAEYDVILKRQSVYFSGKKTGHDLEDEGAFMVIKSLCALNSVPLTTVDYLPALFIENTVNPVVSWITSKSWDGVDRLPKFYETLNVGGDHFDELFRNDVLKVWMLQCVAAADNGVIGCSINRNAVAKFELVLILQGFQGINKTKWLNKLASFELRDYLKDGVHLDTTDRDNMKKAVSSWICELGEIDATFKKSDIAQLKAFLSKQTDEMRLAYARTESRFARRTSFCASVNGEQFLNDSSGSRRFISLPVTACNAEHNIDMQQVWAQVWNDYIKGAIWWTNAGLDGEIKSRNEKHHDTSTIGEMVALAFNINDVDSNIGSHLTPTSILIKSGIREPKPAQAKELTEFLQARGFKRKQVLGVRGFIIYEYPKESSYSNNSYRDEY